MRNLKKCLIKQSYSEIRRTAGNSVLKLPYLNDSFESLVIAGRSESNGSGELLGIGDYDSESGMYSIPISFVGADGASESDEVLLSSPLMKIGGFFDTLDLVTNVVKRKIISVSLSKSSTLLYTDTDGIFKYELGIPAKENITPFSALGELSESSDSGIILTENGKSFLIKISPDIYTIKAVLSYLESNPIKITYVALEEALEYVDFDLPYYEESVDVSFLTELAPLRTYAQYR